MSVGSPRSLLPDVGGGAMRVFDLHLRLLRTAGLAPTVVRSPCDEDPTGIIAFAAPDRLYAVFPDEQEPRFVRVTTGMGFGSGEAPEKVKLLLIANDLNRSFRFVRTVVDGPRRVEFVFETMVDDPEGLPALLEAAVPALARVADSFFERMYLPDRGDA